MSPIPLSRRRRLFRRLNVWPAVGLAIVAVSAVAVCATVGAVLSALSNQ